MNDYIQQLKDYKEKTWKANRTEWTESDVRTLLETGKCDGHSEKSCKCMLSKLRTDRIMKNRFCGLVHEFSDKLTVGKKGGRLNQRLDKEEIELITRHIVPYGREKYSCAAYMSNNKLTDSTVRQPWSYESKKEYEARTGKVAPVEETIEVNAQEAVPTFAETVEKHEVKTSDLDLNLQAVKALMGAGMSFQQIAKVTGKEENLVIALMKVCEAFK